MNESNPEENKIENPEIIDDQGTLGNIQIAIPVVENMVRMVALDVEGVVDVIGAGTGAISGIFTNKSENRSGVKVVEDEAGAYTIEIRVSLAFGVELANVAYNIQTLVLEKITKMTSKGVTKVDVFIDRVEKPLAESEQVVDEPKKSRGKAASKKEEDNSETEVE